MLILNIQQARTRDSTLFPMALKSELDQAHRIVTVLGFFRYGASTGDALVQAAIIVSEISLFRRIALFYKFPV